MSKEEAQNLSIKDGEQLLLKAYRVFYLAGHLDHFSDLHFEESSGPILPINDNRCLAWAAGSLGCLKNLIECYIAQEMKVEKKVNI